MAGNIKLAVDIGSSYIKVLLGNKQRIKQCGLIKTPENSLVDDNIVSIEEISGVLKKFLDENGIKASDVSFAIHGQDIVIRHIEIPLMNTKNIASTVEWEINQYLPENGKNHYIDYEIIEKINTKEEKVLKLLVVAAPKRKIDMYVQLAKVLGLHLEAIDVSANCAARVFRKPIKEYRAEESNAIIDIGYKTSNIIILDCGKLFIEREVPFGIENLVRGISGNFEFNDEAAYKYIFEEFDFNTLSVDNPTHKQIQNQFDEMLYSFEKVIQFFTSNKTKKALDKAFIIGGGSGISGVGSYIATYLNTTAEIVNSPSKLPLKTVFPASCDVRIYLNALGLLLRKE